MARGLKSELSHPQPHWPTAITTTACLSPIPRHSSNQISPSPFQKAKFHAEFSLASSNNPTYKERLSAKTQDHSVAPPPLPHALKFIRHISKYLLHFFLSLLSSSYSAVQLFSFKILSDFMPMSCYPFSAKFCRQGHVLLFTAHHRLK